jgi:Zn-dependent metalloprotease
MNSKRHSVHCIIPPHMLRAMAAHEDAAVREIALRALTTTSMLRGRRQILSQITLARHSEGEHRSVYDCDHTQIAQLLPGLLVRDEGDLPVKDQAVNEAYDALGATYDLYHNIFKRDSIDDHGLRLVASVHYGINFDNAFWDGQQMVFGDGDGKLFTRGGFTKAIDVVGHELTHGVTQYTANLDYQKQSGALNESFSDVFGSLVKQYQAKEDAHSADWLIGEGILVPSIHGKALRSMAEPGTAYDDSRLGGKDPQPAHMKDFDKVPDDLLEDDNGGVHIYSGIPNKAFYLVATQIGGNAWEDAGHIWYETLMHRLGPNSQFQDCADATYQVAGVLFGSGGTQQQAVKEAWDEVGVSVAVGPVRAQKIRRPSAAVEANGAALKKQIEKVVQELTKLGAALGSSS